MVVPPPFSWTEHQVPGMALPLTKAIDDCSASTSSGSPSEPPMSPEPPKLPCVASKLPELSPVCSTLGSKSTSASPLGLMIDTDSLPSPTSNSGHPGHLPPATPDAHSATAGALELQLSSSTPTALPPPPAYYAPPVAVKGLPPAPWLPPGMPEPPKAPPRLPANVPLSPRSSSPPWPKTAPPSTAPPMTAPPLTASPPVSTWQTAPPSQAPTGPPPLDPSLAMSCTLPTGMLTTPGALPSRMMLPNTLQAPHPQQLDHFAVCPPPPPPTPMAGADILSTTSVSLAAASCNSAGASHSLALNVDEEVAVLSMLGFARTGPAVPPLPPSGCYGTLFISSAILESLGAAAEAVEAAARDLGDKPVKVLLPWYPTHGSAAMFDHTKPAKVVLSS
mmetsp:Transcript_112307/g.194731  ORF Transcript_112307/g.194731 Transcript_112307/m.194731 type:complete len:391 (-) Transcript_112307:178-1350(-)